jgi:hypothetical protein
MYEMLSGENPFKKEEQIEFIDACQEILSINIKMPDYFSPDCKDIVSRLLEKVVSCSDLKAYFHFVACQEDRMWQRGN